MSFNAVVSAKSNHRTASCRLGFAEHNKAGKHCEVSFEPYTWCLELNLTNVAAHINLSGVLRDVRKDVDGTERLLRSAFELDPQSPNTRGHISFLLEQRGDLDGAIVQMEGCLRYGGIPGFDGEALVSLKEKKRKAEVRVATPKLATPRGQ